MNSAVPIVICDDSRLARKQIAAALRDWNVDITFAEHGVEALDAIRAGKADILFLDLNMPIMDGYQVLERIRRDDLPTMVIVISGDIQPEAYNRVMALGALAFIKKPCSSDVIAEVLNQYGLLHELQHSAPSLANQEILELPDYYQEIANIAMGQAGNQLARLLDTFVNLPIPRVSLVSPAEVEMILLSAASSDCDLVSQGFVGPNIAGEALLLIKQGNLDTIARLMDMQGQTDQFNIELQMTLSNTLIGAFMSGFSKQLDMTLSRATPIILRHFTELPRQNTQWQKTLMIAIDYQLKLHNFQCELLVIFTEDSLPKLKEMARYFS
ncbi:response regulator [Amphritea sp. 1_MG-2023]|uniref:response regulator n=1 Tax=Amphritea sp. 1_MG-2023 TaxID=3062670 RepID=UPI0026E1668F|nr:response regulator [Amphritea sp. 1_MG-2023]MDO6563894.1 response regulator [Amphritea sp. 1_MG-2023]